MPSSLPLERERERERERELLSKIDEISDVTELLRNL